VEPNRDSRAPCEAEAPCSLSRRRRIRALRSITRSSRPCGARPSRCDQPTQAACAQILAAQQGVVVVDPRLLGVAHGDGAGLVLNDVAGLVPLRLEHQLIQVNRTVAAGQIDQLRDVDLLHASRLAPRRAMPHPCLPPQTSMARRPVQARCSTSSTRASRPGISSTTPLRERCGQCGSAPVCPCGMRPSGPHHRAMA
jgi:hypothetical protein